MGWIMHTLGLGDQGYATRPNKKLKLIPFFHSAWKSCGEKNCVKESSQRVEGGICSHYFISERGVLQNWEKCESTILKKMQFVQGFGFGTNFPTFEIICFCRFFSKFRTCYFRNIFHKYRIFAYIHYLPSTNFKTCFPF